MKKLIGLAVLLILLDNELLSLIALLVVLAVCVIKLFSAIVEHGNW